MAIISVRISRPTEQEQAIASVAQKLQEDDSMSTWTDDEHTWWRWRRRRRWKALGKHKMRRRRPTNIRDKVNHNPSSERTQLKPICVQIVRVSRLFRDDFFSVCMCRKLTIYILWCFAKCHRQKRRRQKEENNLDAVIRRILWGSSLTTIVCRSVTSICMSASSCESEWQTKNASSAFDCLCV